MDVARDALLVAICPTTSRTDYHHSLDTDGKTTKVAVTVGPGGDALRIQNPEA